MTKQVGIIVGSLRSASIARKIANKLIEILPALLSGKIIEIGELPLYNEELEENLPEAYQQFREAVRAVDAVIFVTPEYNRSVPACLKNAIDVGSRPYGKSVWEKKPVAIISHSPGMYGGFGANHHLRQSLVFLDMPVLQQPEMYVGKSAELLTEDGEFSNERGAGMFTNFVNTYKAWVEKFI